ncbi:hypothetical protein EP1X_09790 [Thermococcus sp. EP1]|uniref:hypothetical protein n=1 Tax=Thermococcus sp. EP1 TaxID=1591054 RepID=UPI0006D99E93|nr:hypothetical protein [Thermococcus sp. EP1]KPU62240.1 hypothetical protein EP1X_09790 [Thermococcus sp. EP1]
MSKRKALFVMLIVSFVVFYFWQYHWQHIPYPQTSTSWDHYKYYIGEIPPRKNISLLELSPLTYEKIRMYTIETLKLGEKFSCSEGEFIELQFENGTDSEFACLSGTFGKIVDVPIEELWNLPQNSTVYYSPLVIVRTPPPIEINGTEYIIGVSALYYCDPYKKESRTWEMGLYYPSTDEISRFVIQVNSSLIGEFRGKKVFYVLDIADIKNNTLIAYYSPYCISS